MGTTQTRANKQIWMMNVIKANEINKTCVDEEKLIAEFCFSCLASRKNAIELLNQFEVAKRIIREDGKIYTKENWDLKQFLKNPVLTKEEEEVLKPKPVTEEEVNKIFDEVLK